MLQSANKLSYLKQLGSLCILRDVTSTPIHDPITLQYNSLVQSQRPIYVPKLPLTVMATWIFPKKILDLEMECFRSYGKKIWHKQED